MVTTCGNVQKGGTLKNWIVYFVTAIFLVAICTAHGPTTTPSATPPPHRGAARQMYGSGSLRPPGTKPNYGGLTKQSKTAVTSQPFPVPIRYQDLAFDKLPEGFPIVVPMPPGVLMTSRNRGGMYGGRTEYYGMRRPPAGGLIGGRYPVDLGFIPGRGYGVPQGARKQGFMNRIVPGPVDQYMRQPEEDEVMRERQYDHGCGEDCADGEFLCAKSCICIKDILRCDGETDCDNHEDEIDCGDMEMPVAKDVCEESGRSTRCPKTGRCILKDWLCDGDDDCGDLTDETHCAFAVNCTIDQFECGNGLCIPKTWVCDNDNDCKDFTDESNCTRIGCTEDEYTCMDSTCISLSWRCDKEVDCNDGSDETDCDIEPLSCNSGEFNCGSRKCIKTEFKCDGDNDCGDWTDEEDCPKTPAASCMTDEFKCNNGQCIPSKWRCDAYQDCEGKEDEANCEDVQPRTCSTDEFTCNNGACILKTWECDGVADCSEREDELRCEIICDESKFACSGIGVNDTATEFCINKKHVCDSQKDCPKGEDEKDCPTRKNCTKDSSCSQLCILTADGKDACACQSGYTLNPNGVTCDDINECLYQTDPVCSQTCNNTVGGFRCGCMTGYVLRPDLRSCKALGAPPTLLFANRLDIRQVSLSNQKYTALLKGLHNAIALDYHYDKKLIFWSDVSIDLIKKAFINGTGITEVIKWGLESPGGVALDWVHDLLFWTDSGTRRIEVSTLDGRERAIIAANDLDKPRAIAVHPGEALVFWTDWGPNPKIEKSFMDGSERKTVIVESLFWPNGLTIDYTTSRIYWADAKHNVIETAYFDGSDRRKVITKGLPHPFALTIFEDAIYWTDWHTKSISTANKATGAGYKTIHSKLHFPMDIHSFHSQRQPAYVNHCGTNNGGCAHMCLPNGKSYICVCPMGQKLKPDGKTCLSPEKLLIFARKKDLRLKHLDEGALHQHEVVIPVDGVKSAVALAWDSNTDSIFWTDVEMHTISRAHWNGSNQQVLIRTNIVSPAGLAYDWITDKIYWTDVGTGHIEVAQSDGSMRALLIWEGLDKPRDIVVDPLGGYMYWSDWGEKPKIERAGMDGSNRIVLVKDNLMWPNGLAIDHNAGKLYWADGGTKSIEFSNLDGSNRKTLIEGPDLPHPFGLDVYDNSIYWTDWKTYNIEAANKTTGANRTIIAAGVNGLMDVRIFHRTRRTTKNVCANDNGGCSHLCLLHPSHKGYSCACPVGIKLEDDGKTCRNGSTNAIIMAHRFDIRQISLDVPYVVDVVLPFTQLKNVMSVDVDRRTGEIYWTDTAERVIEKASFDKKHVETIMAYELTMVDAIAIDSSGRKIYWTDGGRNSIEVSELDGSNRRILIWTDLDNPRAITLHYHLGLMFWSDWGAHAKIEVAQMDGSHRKTIIAENLEWPNGLAIDRPTSRLYWNDGKLRTIESSDFHGKQRLTILTNVPHPYGLVIIGSHMYWSDWQTQGLHRADKMTGADRTLVKGKLEGLMDVRSVQPGNVEENACGLKNGGCSHLCLRNAKSYTCACPTGVLLNKTDNKTCDFQPENYLLFATRSALARITCDFQPENYLLFATRSALARISLSTEELWEVTLPTQDIKHAIDVDFHWKKQLLFFTDVKNQRIVRMPMNNLTDTKVIVNENITAPNGLAIDWIAENMYWTDTQLSVVEVAKLDGTSRKVLVRDNLNEPRSVAVFPKKGFLYWTEWGKEPKIERAFMDGSSRKTIVVADLGFPNGLAIDYKTNRLYWTDARWDKIENCDLHGGNRIQLTHPFGLAIFERYIYWTDWFQKTILRADKSTGKNYAIVRANLDGAVDGAVGIRMVAESRQHGWNPCAVNNGGCTHLCFFRFVNYTCGCPDIPDESCKLKPKEWVSLKSPHPDEDVLDDYYDASSYDTDNTEYDDMLLDHSETALPKRFYIITLIPMLCILVLTIILLVVAFLYRKSKKKYLYATGRRVMAFSNPNYYTSNSEPVPNNVDKKPCLWKRLKYDKSQDRVYEIKTGSTSPEVASLIPTVLTPSSSNCEAVTPELERSPSVTPLHRTDSIAPVV
ncbi:Low-density lipoprotein receptor domain class A [Popillia japonica]|uniref:Low-density lipoprotein receptor domain class A n=1 Tax=Popillia japonica TaxID=7064 RepID=A0AAW1L8U6_POPJA